MSATDLDEAKEITLATLGLMEVSFEPDTMVAEAGDTASSTAVSVELDLREAEPVRPDDAVTRLRFVIRKTTGATWGVVRDERRNCGESVCYQWPPDDMSSRRPETMLHPAIRAADITATSPSDG